MIFRATPTYTQNAFLSTLVWVSQSIVWLGDNVVTLFCVYIPCNMKSISWLLVLENMDSCRMYQKSTICTYHKKSSIAIVQCKTTFTFTLIHGNNSDRSSTSYFKYQNIISQLAIIVYISSKDREFWKGYRSGCTGINTYFNLLSFFEFLLL